jgi:hypothetical protein
MLGTLMIAKDLFQLKLLVLQTLYDWVFAVRIFSIHSMMDLIDHCSF